MNDPYVEGKYAYNEGKRKNQNPYDDFSPEATLWRAGWRDGQLNDEEYNKKAA